MRPPKVEPFDTLERRAEDQPHSTAFVFRDEAWSYARLLRAAESLTGALAAQGVRPGDRVALHMRNLPELFVAYLGCFRLGAVAAPINTRLKTAEVRSLLQRLQVKLYLGQDVLLPVVADVEEDILPAQARFATGRAADFGVRSWRDLLSSQGGALPPFADANTLALLLTTSGTTGEPKFVAHTHATLSAMVGELVGNRIAAAGAQAVTTPLVHGMGLLTLLAAIRTGAPAVVLETFDAEALLDAVARYGVGVLFAAPFMYAELIERQRARPRNVESLAVCLVGGDACAPGLQTHFVETFGRPLRNVWGSAEVGMLGAAEGIGPLIRSSDWLAADVVGDGGAEVGIGGVGELLVRGPSVTPGYWLGPGQVQDPKRHGWFATGDLVRREAPDEFLFVGRKKELIICGGSNIAPLEVEMIIRAHPAVAEVVVTGVPDERLGQRVAALIVPANPASPGLVSDILAWTRRALADYKVPERIEVVDEIPRNALGKVDRRKAADLLKDSGQPS